MKCVIDHANILIEGHNAIVLTVVHIMKQDMKIS